MTTMDGQEQRKDLAMTEKTVLNDLNDDCLEYIFKLVRDLPNQTHIAMCCDRFGDVIENLWKRQSKHRVLDMRNLFKTFRSSDDFMFYLTAMRTEFRTVICSGAHFDEFLRIIANCCIECFPCVERLENYVDSNVYQKHSHDVYIFSKLFPNLKYLEIYRPFTVHCTIYLEFLEELTLSKYCYSFTPTEGNNLRKMILTHKLLRVLDTWTFYNLDLSNIPLVPSLQVLRLSINTLKPILNKVIQLPLLKELSVRLDRKDQTAELREFVSQQGSRLHGISLNVKFPRIWSPWLMVNLKFLALCDVVFTVDVFYDCHFKKLEILRLRNCEFRTIDVVELIRRCPVLKHLDISFCHDMKISMLEDISNYWKRERPDQVLSLCCKVTSFEREIEQNYSFWSTQKHLRLTDDLIPEWDGSLLSSERKINFTFNRLDE